MNYKGLVRKNIPYQTPLIYFPGNNRLGKNKGMSCKLHGYALIF